MKILYAVRGPLSGFAPEGPADTTDRDTPLLQVKPTVDSNPLVHSQRWCGSTSCSAYSSFVFTCSGGVSLFKRAVSTTSTILVNTKLRDWSSGP